MNTALMQQILCVDYDGCLQEDCQDIDFSMRTSADYPWPTEGDQRSYLQAHAYEVRLYRDRQRYQRKQKERARQHEDAERKRCAGEYQAAVLLIRQHQEPTMALVNRLLDAWDAKMLGRKFPYTHLRQIRIDTCVWDLQALNRRVALMGKGWVHGL